MGKNKSDLTVIKMEGKECEDVLKPRMKTVGYEVYLAGKGEIINNFNLEIHLPEIKKKEEYFIQITQIVDVNNSEKVVELRTSEVINNYFIVYGKNTKFFWTLFKTISNF